MDLYRLESGRPESFHSIDLPNVFRNAICLVEWPERLPDNMVPQDRLDVRFTIRPAGREDSGNDGSFGTEEAERILVITPHGSCWTDLMKDIVQAGYLDDLLV